NRADLAEFGSLLSRNVRVQFRFPARPLSKTRLAHTYVLPSDHEVFILNSFYRDGQFVSDKLQGLWVGDMDFVRVQLEATLLDLQFLRDQGGRRRRPDLDGEGLRLRVDEQGDGDLHPLERFRLLVDRLEDLDDVHAERTERGSEGRTGRRLAAIDEDLEFLHDGPASGRVAVSVPA